MESRRLKSIGVAMGAAMVAAAPRLANACAMCGLPPGDTAGHAYNASVLFMLAGPYVTVLAIGGIVFAAWKRAQRRAQTSPVSPTARR